MWCYKKSIISVSILLLISILISCGFKPLYNSSEQQKEIFGILKIPELSTKEGFHLREELIRRFGDPNQFKYFLDLKIDTTKLNEVISTNNEITSYRLIMTANYSIRDADGNIVLPNQRSIARTTFSSAQNSTSYITQVAEDAAKKRLAIKIGSDISVRILILSEKWLK